MSDTETTPKPEDPADGTDAAAADLGFTYLATKSGVVFIRHHGRLASELRGADAVAFLKKIDAADFAEEQQIMARITGNYKRGNERTSGRHARNS